MEPKQYHLTPEPPLSAPAAAHAATLRQIWFEISPRTIEGWPCEKALVNGRRQPLTLDVWATAASMWLSDDPRRNDPAMLERALARLPDEFAAHVRMRVPAAREALRRVKADRAAKARERAQAA